MPEIVSFKITGGREIARALEEKPPIVARQIVRTSLRKAVIPWQQEMIARVRKGWHVFGSFISAKGLRAPRGGRGQGGREREFGVISRNIRIVTKLDGDYAGQAAVTPSKKAFWARFLEFGTKHQRAFPFIRPAFEAKKQNVLDEFIEDVREQLHTELRMR